MGGEGTSSSTGGDHPTQQQMKDPLLTTSLEDPLVHTLRFLPDNAIVEEMNCCCTREERCEEDIFFENLVNNVIVQQYL